MIGGRTSDGRTGTANRSALMAAAGAAVIATSGVLILYADESPATVAFFRGLYALPVLIVLAYLERRRLGRPRDRRGHLFALLAGLLLGATFLFQNASMVLVGAAIATVVGNLQVLLVTVAAWVLFGERPTGRFLAALPVALVAVVFVSGVLDEQAYGADPVTGLVMCLATSLAYAGFLLALRHSQRVSTPDVSAPAVRAPDINAPDVGAPDVGARRDVHVDDVPVDDVRRRAPAYNRVPIAGPLAVATAVASVVALLGGPFFGGVDLVPSLPAHGWLVALALGPQVLGWLLIVRSMPRLPVATAALILLLQPLLAVVLAMTLLTERPSALQLVGCVLLLGAVVFGALAGQPRPKPPNVRKSTDPTAPTTDSKTLQS